LNRVLLDIDLLAKTSQLVAYVSVLASNVYELLSLT